MGPAIFEPFAIETARRVFELSPKRVLEVAAGTGRLTRHLRPLSFSVTTDLHDDMLGIAVRELGRGRYALCNAEALPFQEQAFDLLVCQFGMMFVKDKKAAYREARRVLRPGGSFVMTVWGPHSQNQWGGIVHRTMLDRFPTDTPGFMAVPFSYNDSSEIESSLARSGFKLTVLEEVTMPIGRISAHDLAFAAIEGSSLGGLIRKRGVEDVAPVIESLAAAYTDELGDPVQSTITAHYYVATAQ